VLGYFVSPENVRTRLLPALAENPSISEEALDGLAVSGSRSVVDALLTSPRVMSSPRLLQALQSNASLRPNELAEIGKKLAALEASPAAESGATEADAPDEVVEGAVIKYLEENAAELVAEKDKPFQPIGMAHDGMAHEGLAHEDVSGEAAH
jgi:cellobiose-specific phosphotransferase system component IIB